MQGECFKPERGRDQQLVPSRSASNRQRSHCSPLSQRRQLAHRCVQWEKVQFQPLFPGSLNNRMASGLPGPVLTHSPVTIWRRVSLLGWQLRGLGHCCLPLAFLTANTVLPCCFLGEGKVRRGQSWGKAGQGRGQDEEDLPPVQALLTVLVTASLQWECSAVTRAGLAGCCFWLLPLLRP